MGGEGETEEVEEVSLLIIETRTMSERGIFEYPQFLETALYPVILDN